MRLTTSKPIINLTKAEWNIINNFAEILIRDLDIEESEDYWDILTDIYYDTKENDKVIIKVEGE